MTSNTTSQIHSVLVGPEDTNAEHRIVFLHGLFGRGKNFTRIARALEPDAQSLLVDLPNHGQSTWTEEFSFPLLADLVAEHLRGGFAANGPVDIVGHSMGGKVAMVLALRHPDLVRRLVILDISPTSTGSARSEFEHLLDSLATLDVSTITRRADADEQLQELIPHPGVRGFLLQNLVRSGDRFAWEPNLALLRAEIQEVMGFPDMLGEQCVAPVLWINGSRSVYVTEDDEPAMRALFPHTVRKTFEGAGHWVHSDKPDETIAALREFLFDD